MSETREVLIDEQKGLWAAGQVHCSNCGKDHMSVWYIPSQPIECPDCGQRACLPYGFESEVVDAD